MSTPSVWFINNDMLVTLSGLRTSTMSSTAYLNSSTHLLLDVWKAQSTGSSTNRVVSNQVMGYLAGTNGNYRTVVQSTSYRFTYGQTGLALVHISQSGLDAEWRTPFFVEARRST